MGRPGSGAGLAEGTPESRQARYISVIGRLRSHVGRAQAEEDMPNGPSASAAGRSRKAWSLLSCAARSDATSRRRSASSPHDQQLEVWPQGLLRVARQCEAEIGIQRALVKFVEQHRGNAFEGRVVDHKARENAFGDHLDPRSLRDPRAEPHAQTDSVTDLLAKGHRHG